MAEQTSERTRERYDAALANEIEERWQRAWAEAGAFRQPNPGEPEFDGERPKFYVLDMFPYPSGAGLHVGHPEGYTATDILARYKRMRGCNVLHPMGWDAFGLPAEQYAIQTGVHPAETTKAAINNFRRQLQRFGFSYDWSREVATIDPGYYRWTQWIFLRLYESWFDPDAPRREGRGRARPIVELVEELERDRRRVAVGGRTVPAGHRLFDGAETWETLSDDERREVIDGHRMAYVGEQTVNWCPKLGTALANEEVIDGRSERGGYPVFRKPLKQWMLRITAYAERLLEGLEDVDWPQSTKAMQAQWIGRSEGAEVVFRLEMAKRKSKSSNEGMPAAHVSELRVFTTRPDTIFGATFMVVAPEHPLVEQVLREPEEETDVGRLREYVERARNRSDVERQEAKEKTGVFTGVYATNPATGEPIPVWVADYVLMGYGTGAIMAVPAHDERDGEFALKFSLPIRKVVVPPEEWLRANAPTGADAAGSAAQLERAYREAERDRAFFTGEGAGMQSANAEVSLDGLATPEAKRTITDWLESRGLGERRVNYRLRDWLFSRQRYWGEPFPIVFDERGRHYPVHESKLPVELPPLEDFAPEESDDPRPLLAKADRWVQTTAGEAGVRELAPETVVYRETNTMPGWAGSCWYYLRYCDPRNDERFVGEEAERYWVGRLSEPTSVAKGSPSRDLAAEASDASSAESLLPVALDTLPDGPVIAAGFVPRDPYPEGTYGPAPDLIAHMRRLPHFEMPKATYFVTWRTRGRKLDDAQRTEVLKTLLHFDGERCRTYAACVMPDHVHWVVRPYEGQKLGDLVASVKRYSARAANAAGAGEGSVWQPDCFDHIIRDEVWFGKILRYVVDNPVEEGLAKRRSAYRWTFVHADSVRGRDEREGPARHASAEDGGESARRADLPRGEIVGSESRPTQGGVDLYIGGAEHAVLHLLYARFWHKVLFDLGYVSSDEPFRKLFHQGLITSFAFKDSTGRTVPVDEVEERAEGEFYLKATGERVEQIVAKMSKTLKNVINPDDVIAEFGADTFRLYEMYMGPLEASKPWNTRDISGLMRFCQRAWRLVIDEDSGEPRLGDAADEEVEKLLHRTIAKVGDDVERLSFNTAIAAMIEFVNAATAKREKGGAGLSADQARRFSRMLSPFAPHLAEELWSRLGGEGLVCRAEWPAFDEAMLVDETIELPVQIKGKVRARIHVPTDADQAAVERAALEDPRVREHLGDTPPRKVIVVPGRMVNIVPG